MVNGCRVYQRHFYLLSLPSVLVDRKCAVTVPTEVADGRCGCINAPSNHRLFPAYSPAFIICSTVPTDLCHMLSLQGCSCKSRFPVALTRRELHVDEVHMPPDSRNCQSATDSVRTVRFRLRPRSWKPFISGMNHYVVGGVWRIR